MKPTPVIDLPLGVHISIQTLGVMLAHAALISSYVQDFTQIDLTAAAVASRPNRVALPAEPAPWSPGHPLSLLFVGSLDYFPNEEAARLLVLHLAPLLQRRLAPPWSLTIAGRAAPPGRR